MRSSTQSTWWFVVATLAGCVSVASSAFLVVDWTTAFDRFGSALMLALSVLAVALWRLFPPTVSRISGDLRAHFVLFTALGLGFFFRVAFLPSFPPRLGFSAIEEVQSGIHAFAVLYEGSRPWQFLQTTYSAALGMMLFDDRLFGMRVAAVAWGVAALPAFFLLAQRLTNAHSAALATALFGASHWHVAISRYHRGDCAGSTSFLIASALVWAAVTGGGAAPALLAGAMAGLSLYDYQVYQPACLIVSLPILYPIFSLLKLSPRGSRPLTSSTLNAYVFGLSCVAAPAVFQMWSNPNQYFDGFLRAAAGTSPNVLEALKDRMGRFALAYAVFFRDSGVASFAHVISPDAPLLFTVPAIFFFIGLLAAVIRPSPIVLYLWLSFLIFFAGTVLFVPNLDLQRLAALAPLSYLFVALGLEGSIAALRRLLRWGDIQWWVKQIAMAAILVAGVSVEARYLFGYLFVSPSIRERFMGPYESLTFAYNEFLVGLEPTIVTLEARSFGDRNDFMWLLREPFKGTVQSDQVAAVTGPLTSHPLVFQRPLELELIKRWLDEERGVTACSFHHAPDDTDHSFVICEPDRELPARSRFAGLQAKYSIESSIGETIERTEPFLDLGNLPEKVRTAIARNIREVGAEWRFAFVVPPGNSILLRLQKFRCEGSIQIDGVEDNNNEMVVGPGAHELYIRAKFGSDPAAALRLVSRSNRREASKVWPAWLYELSSSVGTSLASSDFKIAPL